ncbi:prolyl hydroxylase family protein [Novosphingobium sp. MBES04]|uniref:prolyl hydroxylase family protein n=1 Tax=Novosphingobium sp. MBES04 TaxID=1206458 RepID=UPI00057E3F63|nr:2OG-Fe(II) oxygenase [Novosphingobium sp. MBES04]GAM07103.1 2OG-Fe(II) oxygenase [Novosphingobium sp. MBES04]
MVTATESYAVPIQAHPAARKVPSSRIEMYILPNFLSGEQCARLIDKIETQHRPSTITGYNGDDVFRTSSTCDLSPRDPDVADLRARLSALSGIPESHAEPLQGQRYEVGQEFKAHTDYFEPDRPEFDQFCSVAGQRTWTYMMYLNAVDAGGATRFKVADKIVQPEAGKLICWNNLRPDGSPNAATLHHAMKVRKGAKYVLTQWFREKPWG